MAERYQRLLKHDEPLYLKDSPVIIDAYALLKDTVTDEIKGQIKFLSVSKKRIKALTVRIIPKDTANKKIDEPFEFEYLDLSEDRDHYFGNKQAINMPNKSTREFDVRVIRVVFTDNTEWNNDGISEWEFVKRPTSLRSLLNNDLCKQFKLDYHKDPCSMNLYSESDDLWYCSCGVVNLADETICHRCKESKEKLSSYNFDEFLVKLKASRKEKEEKDAIEAEERRKKRAQEAEIERQRQEKEKAEKDEKIKKIKSHIFKIYLPIVVVVITVVLVLNFGVIPYTNYQKGVEAMEKHDYVAAMEYLAKAKNQRDSLELMQNMCSNREVRTLCEQTNYIRSSLIELEPDGSLISDSLDTKEQYDLGSWKNIAAINIDGHFLTGLTKDGKVTARIQNYLRTDANREVEEFQCNDVKDIKAGSYGYDGYYIAALKNDGTVSLSINWRKNVAKWSDISVIDTCEDSLVGISKNGRVYFSDENHHYEMSVQNSINKWKDIIDVVAMENSVLALRKDCTLVSSRENVDLTDINANKDIIAISADTNGKLCSVLKKDGTVEVYRFNFDYFSDGYSIDKVSIDDKGNLTNIKKVSLGYSKVLCITEDNKYKLADVYF